MAVLVVSGIGLLVAGTTLLLVRAETRGVAHVAESARSRALAWSGLQAVAVELAAQRDRMIEGERPELAGQYVIEEDGPRLGVVRLLPVAPGGERLASEAAKADLARVTAAELEASGLVEADLAAAVISARDRLGGRIDSVAGLVGASESEIDAEDLYGDPEELGWRDAIRGVEADRAERILDRLTPPEPRGLADLLSVHAVEPSIDASGRPRIAISPPWSEEMDAEIRERLNDEVADGVRAILNGDSFIEQLIEGLSLGADRDLAELFVRITCSASSDRRSAPDESTSTSPRRRCCEPCRASGRRRRSASSRRGSRSTTRSVGPSSGRCCGRSGRPTATRNSSIGSRCGASRGGCGSPAAPSTPRSPKDPSRTRRSGRWSSMRGRRGHASR
jgi:hypothetical protein